MPTYDYVCDACDHKFELFQSITEAVKKKCPECKKPKLRRLFGTGAALMFKGSGFYTTDYRSEGYKKRASEEKPSSSSSDAKSGESKSESKSGGSDSKTSSSDKTSPKGESKTKNKSD
jgi:putative FmdB family regulatory protein